MKHTGPEIRQTPGYRPPSAELVSGVFRMIRERSTPHVADAEPASARQLAAHLRHDLGPIMRSCEMLESHGVITKAWARQSHSSPRYNVTPEGQWAARAGAREILDFAHKSLAEVVVHSWARNFGMPLNVSSLAIGGWEYADEDLTAFVCAAGQAEGSIAFSMNRGFLIKSLAHAGGHDYRDIGTAVRKYFRALIEKVVADVGTELAAEGFDIALSDTATLVGKGTLLSNPRDVRYLTDLTNRYGRLKFRVTMRDVLAQPLAA